jgi:lipoprotein-anchoring transpeptidase ErfK/SrfK
VTDLATKAGADEAQPPAEAATDAPTGGGPDNPTYAWASQEPRPHKSRKPLWIGAAAGVAVVGLFASSLVLIAPGTSVAGVGIGFLTPGAAVDAVQHRLATTTIVLTGEGGDAEVTGADLGASVDARSLVDQAFAEHPMWNVTAWFPASVSAPVFVDAEAADSALRAAAPELYVDPVDATLTYDADTATYVTTPAEEGVGIDVDAVRAALQDAFEAGETRVELDTTLAPVTAQTPTYVAEGAAAQLNGMLSTAGFYVGKERTVPVSREVAASWLTVTPGDRGTFAITADQTAIEKLVPSLAEAVNREVVNATVVTDSGGAVLSDLTAGVTGRALGDTSDVAADFAAQLATGNAAYQLPVTETEFATTALERRIEVDLSAQTTYLFENDKVIASYAISSGLAGTPTFTGSYRVFAHTSMQDMGCFEGAPYCTENVPWITWFNGDQGFHGAYWHNNFGNPMSHGCVNMPINIAKFVYDWSPVGTEVWVHA